MKRGSVTSGGDSHVELVKLATKRVVDSFQNLRYILLSYEQQNFTFDLKVTDGIHGYTNANFEFRPDIVVRAENCAKGTSFQEDEKKWESPLDSSAIVIEAETNPKNFFSNTLKVEAYKQIKSRGGRGLFAFVLACWSDAVLPDNIEPFDEVWKFPKEDV